MTKKPMDSKKTNISKKVAPLVMSTSMVAASFLAAGAPISAAEFDKEVVKPEVVEKYKNHGQAVSALARSLPGGPEKGKLVSALAQSNVGKVVAADEDDDDADETDGDTPVAEEPEAPEAPEEDDA